LSKSSEYAALVLDYRCGDDSALSETWDKLKNLVFSHLSRIGVKTTHPIFADLVNHSYYAMYRCMREGAWDEGSGSAFHTYAMRAIRNEITDQLRKENKHSQMYSLDAFQYEDGSPADLPYEDIDYNSVWNWVEDADSDVMYMEALEIIRKELTGWSTILFALKRVIPNDEEIKSLLKMSHVEYTKRMNLLHWRVSYILLKHRLLETT